jgi:hypothetical protein
MPLLELWRRQKLISEDHCTILKEELEILAKMLSALIKEQMKQNLVELAGIEPAAFALRTRRSPN